ncbi:MAG: multi-sensor hybrid histidine kinase [Thermoleophilia bacterium]|nr:multi-sensor hybrid histidine kinase [Thermoleophilia bacterium]
MTAPTDPTDQTDQFDQTAPDRLIEELRATVQMKDHLLQMVSHEMRTPLVSITNFASTMLRAWDVVPDDDKREYMEIILQQSTRLSRLVNDLLAVARLEAGRLRTVTERVELREVAQETVTEIATGGADISISVADDAAVTADRDHVKQILVNYVTNALKYGRGPIEIASEADGDDVRLWVEDHGDGVSEEFRPHLFEKFSQQEAAHEKVGTGLGLSIVQGLALAQHGSAWYEHADDGARFGVTIPRG